VPCHHGPLSTWADGCEIGGQCVGSRGWQRRVPCVITFPLCLASCAEVAVAKGLQARAQTTDNSHTIGRSVRVSPGLAELHQLTSMQTQLSKPTHRASSHSCRVPSCLGHAVSRPQAVCRSSAATETASSLQDLRNATQVRLDCVYDGLSWPSFRQHPLSQHLPPALLLQQGRACPCTYGTAPVNQQVCSVIKVLGRHPQPT